MYHYRRMTPEQRERVVRERHEQGFPWHAPPHLRGLSGAYLITAACFQHQHIFADPSDLSWLLDETMHALNDAELACSAWVFLPNHYHLLLQTEDLAIVSEALRLLHSHVATEINGRQQERGRRVWYRFGDRFIRSERHHWASVNYIHYNPVKHGYVDRMTDWPWSSIHEYVEQHGKQHMLKMWRDVPIGDYGKGRDW